MEAVGFAASIIGIIQVTGKLASVTYSYLSGFKKAPKDITELVNELHTLGIVLRSLQDYAEKNPTSPTLQKLNEPDGPIPVFFKELKELHLKFNSIDTSTFSERLKWPLKERDVTQYISKIERHKSLFKFALDVDHISLSKAIEAYVVNIDLATEYIKAHVRDTALAVQEIKVDVKDTSVTVQEIKADVGDTNIAIWSLQSTQSAWMDQNTTTENAETRAKVLDWLYSEPFETKHIETSGRRREGTGGWLLNSPEFCKLIKKERESTLLWGYGIPGAGKTFLSSTVIDYLQDKAQENKYGVAYIYFDYKEQKQQRPLQVLASLVKQLAAQTPQLPTYITDLHKKLTKEKKRPTQQDFYSALVSTLKLFGQAFFVFDALDECNQNQQRRELLPLFHRIVQENNNASIFLTSRQYPEDIQVSFHDSAKIELRANDEDIKCYIQQKINGNPRAKRLVERGGSKDKIISQLTKCANGMFLLVHFHIELICQQTTTKKITKELERLNLESSGTEGSPLDPTYERAVRSIHTQAESCIELAIKIFTWLVKAQRTLTVDELRMAVSVEAEVYELEDDDLPDKATLLDVCAGLVTIDEKSNTVRLAHYTVQEYILRSSLIPENADVDLAITCLTFLSFDIFAQGACISNELLQSRIEAYPFLNYVVFKLPFHLKACDEVQTKEPVLKFLENPNIIASYSQISLCINLYGRIRNDYEGYCNRYPKQLPLHVVSAIGHHIALQSLIEQGADVLKCNSEGDTALHHAAKNDHEELVRLLLKNSADITTKGEYGDTALHKAAMYGHTAVVHLLLENGADINTALHRAAVYGHTAVVQLLLENGADITTKGEYGDTALHQAAEYGHTAVVQLLLENGADITTEDIYRDTALHNATMYGREAVVQILLENGADINAKGRFGNTVLHKAAENGHTAVVQILLENGADITTKDKYGNAALHKAAEYGCTAVVQLLLENGADITTKGEYGDTALHKAAIYGDAEVVQLLLKNGADIATKGKYGYTALHQATKNGHKAVVQLLLENGADITTEDKYGNTALHKAAENGHTAVVQILLENGADITIKGRGGDTALHNATENGHTAVIQLLLENGADINTKGRGGETGLHKAAENGHTAVVQLLLENGADINAKGRFGNTVLHKAAEKGHIAVVQLLLENSADITARNNGQKTALESAVDRRWWRVKRLIQRIINSRTSI